MALGMALFCSSIFRCLILGSFGHTRLDRVSQLLWVKYIYQSLSPHCDTASLSEEMTDILLNCTIISVGYSDVTRNWWHCRLRMLFGRHSELVLTRCCVRGLFRNGQGAAELAFGSDTAALFLPILSSPLVLTPQSVRTQFRMALGVTLFYKDSFVVILIWLLFATSFPGVFARLIYGFILWQSCMNLLMSEV